MSMNDRYTDLDEAHKHLTLLNEPLRKRLTDFGPEQWVEELKSGKYTHHMGSLGRAERPIHDEGVHACCLGVLAWAADVAHTDGSHIVITSYHRVSSSDAHYVREMPDPSVIDKYIAPWWLELEPSPECEEFLADFGAEGALTHADALMQINDYQGVYNEETDEDEGGTVDYSKQIEYIERFVLPAWRAGSV